MSATTEDAVAIGKAYPPFIGDGNVLTIAFPSGRLGFPPAADQAQALNGIIQGLARAIKSVVYQSENDDREASFLVQPVEDLASAIIVLSMLSQAVQSDLEERASEAQT